jgi:hypothetical protein
MRHSSLIFNQQKPGHDTWNSLFILSLGGTNNIKLIILEQIEKQFSLIRNISKMSHHFQNSTHFLKQIHT